ncbi:UV damage repair protein UvrX [Treponema phagedenis]|uniref:UV damage repair protein UvrX n=1 Tax=Treponema phagedenis TaxID=162 RepID=A0A0B7GXF4_TREPH|nr:UvrB/UvrC motif-containing protein [Treponema phagedenis]EFW39398.1 hypothetical protein HMPREF9554_00091 [Treponema phagedenis F0421]NVP22985.1 UvrB/UvrC motif-containing protein [Treponema phagedenis]QEJ95107.1 UV damage repair protein UvrX [Treponema phagedenis]QEJ98219.1 UV damage repair protein UvrX [Treponema phagedenis]QEK01032.1 UV damage repair protein UvrX [Treponema phagedenis]
MMKCKLCGTEGAEVFVQQIVQNKIKEMYICRDCAEKYGLYAKDNSNIDKAISHIFSHEEILNKENSAHDENSSAPSCPVCGSSLNDIQSKKMIGCPSCFFYFQNDVTRIMREKSVSIIYTDDVPRELSAPIPQAADISELKNNLARAIEMEKYELAAYYRDKLNELKEQIKYDH